MLTLLACVLLRAPQEVVVALWSDLHEVGQPSNSPAVLQGVLPKQHEGAVFGQQELQENPQGGATQAGKEACGYEPHTYTQIIQGATRLPVYALAI